MTEQDGVRDRIVSEILAVSDVEIAPAGVSDAMALRGDLGFKSLQAVTLALNLLTQGVDPKLDLSQLDEAKRLLHH